jgi:hypothetical protein
MTLTDGLICFLAFGGSGVVRQILSLAVKRMASVVSSYSNSSLIGLGNKDRTETGGSWRQDRQARIQLKVHENRVHR